MIDTAKTIDEATAIGGPFRKEGMGYVFEPNGLGVRLRADYIEQTRGEMWAEVVVESTLPGIAQHLFRTRTNLLVSKNVKDLSAELAGAISNPITALSAAKTFAESVILFQREGEPFTTVGQRPTRLRPADRVERLAVEGKATLLYGPGGIGKGYLAWGMAVCVQLGIPFAGLKVQQGNVLYLDWEDDDDEADERIKEVSRGLGVPPPAIHYRWMSEPLHANINRLARFIAEHQIQFIVIDSFELAAGGAGDRGTYEEAAKRLFRALRGLGPVTPLLIDHVTDAARTNKGQVNKAYGSAFKGNWARRSFEIKADFTGNEPINHLGLYLFKTNRGERGQPIGVAVDFKTSGTVKFYREDVRDNPELSQALPMVDQITTHLTRHGPTNVAGLAEALKGETTKDAQAIVRTTLNRWLDKRFAKVEGTDRWSALLLRPVNFTPTPLRQDVTQEPDFDF